MKQIFLIGGSGYIGGAVLERLVKRKEFNIKALTRHQSQVEGFKNIGAEPVFTSNDKLFETVKKLAKESDIVITAADVDDLNLAKYVVSGLLERNDPDSILLHTSGTGLLNGLQGEAFDDMNMEDIHKRIPKNAIHKNVDQYIFDSCEDNLKAVILAPSTIHGISKGPFNKLSQQVPLITKGQINSKKPGYPTREQWNYIHINDLVDMYELIIDSLLAGSKDYGKAGGFYFGCSGTFTWDLVSAKVASELKKHCRLDSSEIVQFTPDEVKKYLNGIPFLRSYGVSNRAKKLGWSVKQSNIYETVPEEVQYILDNHRY